MESGRDVKAKFRRASMTKVVTSGLCSIPLAIGRLDQCFISSNLCFIYFKHMYMSFKSQS